MTPPHHALTFIGGDPDNQIAPDDPATHSISIHEGETAEHPAFGDVFPSSEEAAYSLGEPLVVSHVSVSERTPSMTRLAWCEQGPRLSEQAT